MPIEFEMKVIEVSGSLKTTIPKQVAKALNVEEGDTVIVGLDGHRMIVWKKK